jgi:hypothetical protein
MALYNEILAGRYNRALSKLAGIKGEAPAPQLASEIAATISMFYGVENRFIEGWYRYGLAVVSPAVAGQFSVVRIAMPVGANVIAVIESCEIAAGANDIFNLIYTNLNPAGDFGTLNFGSMLYSSRASSTPGTLLTGSAAHVSFASTVGLIANPIRKFAITANPSREIIQNENQELTLTSGEGYTVQPSTVNEAVTVSFLWRERPLEDSEKS